MTKSERPPDTAARLRKDLDAGRGRDKVAYPDPSAAPLGTDDEAAGTPITERQAQMARAQEVRDGGTPPRDPARTAGATGHISAPGRDRTSSPELDPAGPEPQGGAGGRVLAVAFTILVIVALPVLVFVFPP